MPKVFVIQDDGSKNLNPVLQYSDEIVVLATKNFPTLSQEKIRTHVLYMKDKFREFDPDTDYIVAIGDPINIGIVTHFMMQRGGGQILKWDRQTTTYSVIDLRKGKYS